MEAYEIGLSDGLVINKIYINRGQKVMLDRDLAALYGVETKVLKQAVKRNLPRFPEDFMFEMNEMEMQNWRSQFVTSSWGWRKILLIKQQTKLILKNPYHICQIANSEFKRNTSLLKRNLPK